MTSSDHYYSSGRQARNERTRTHATRSREPWTGPELLTVAEWDGTEDGLVIVATRLQRSCEAVRQRYYLTFGRHARERAKGEPIRATNVRELVRAPKYDNWPAEDRSEFFA